MAAVNDPVARIDAARQALGSQSGRVTTRLNPVEDLQLGARQLSVVSPEDKNLQPVMLVEGFPTNLKYQPWLPTRDSTDLGVVRCVHCLLLPKGMQDVHQIVAIANPDLKPQRAWFFTDMLGHAARGRYGNWEINSERAKLTLYNGEVVIWKLTDIYAGPALQLGVWAD